MVEWWSAGVMEWWSGGVVECWSAGVLELWSGGVLEWWSAGDKRREALTYLGLVWQPPIGVNLRRLCDRHLTRGGRASPRAGNRSIIGDIA